jgi:site-specific recombinase XerD
MAKARLVLDTRDSSKSSINGLYPIALRVFHKKPRLIRLSFYTSPSGWDNLNFKLKKSALANKNQDCDYINEKICDQLYKAQKLINELGEELSTISVDSLIEHIKLAWHEEEGSVTKRKINNSLSLQEWTDVIIQRKLKANKTGTAKWYKGAIDTFKKFNNGKDIKLYDITVSFLRDFQVHHENKGNSHNGISAYMRALRAVYNSAIKEDKFTPIKNAFQHYRIPRTQRTKKRAIPKEKFLAIRNLNYTVGTEIWHTKNYVFVMFNCRGMNFVDLTKLRMDSIVNDRLNYGRSKTGQPLSVKITTELAEILNYYINSKGSDDFIFPVGFDGKSENYTTYLSNRRRVNKLLKIIAQDVGIEERFTTYSIRHSWATIAKYLGVSTEIISESLGHNSLKTTEIYLKSFQNAVLDDANDLVVS